MKKGDIVRIREYHSELEVFERHGYIWIVHRVPKKNHNKYAFTQLVSVGTGFVLSLPHSTAVNVFHTLEEHQHEQAQQAQQADI